MKDNLRRVIVDFKKLTPEILALLVEKYPDGYDDKHIIEFKNAKNYFEKAMQIDPNHPDVNFSFGMLLLSMSDFKNGLIKYEWRKKLPININFKAPE